MVYLWYVPYFWTSIFAHMWCLFKATRWNFEHERQIFNEISIHIIYSHFVNEFMMIMIIEHSVGKVFSLILQPLILQCAFVYELLLTLQHSKQGTWIWNQYHSVSSLPYSQHLVLSLRRRSIVATLNEAESLWDALQLKQINKESEISYV